MCETRHEFKIARSAYKTTKDSSSPIVEADTPRMPKQQRVPRARGEGPRSEENTKDGDKKSWTMVDKKDRPKQSFSKTQK
jgi:hypothetical protein